MLLIEKSGATRYFEYGRYPTHDETKGKVEKRYLENNIVFDKGGFPTQESLNKVMKELSTKFGQGGAIRAAYIETENVEKMLDYAWEKTKESNPKWSDKETPYNPDREPYSVYGNNCGTFAKDVIEQDENVDMPWVIITSPNNIVDDIIDKGNTEITFDPKTQKTNVIKSKKEDKTQ